MAILYPKSFCRCYVRCLAFSIEKMSTSSSSTCPVVCRHCHFVVVAVVSRLFVVDVSVAYIFAVSPATTTTTIISTSPLYFISFGAPFVLPISFRNHYRCGARIGDVDGVAVVGYVREAREATAPRKIHRNRISCFVNRATNDCDTCTQPIYYLLKCQVVLHLNSK